jgi:hypothetical protein
MLYDGPRSRGDVSGSRASVISAAKLATGALLSCQSSCLMSRFACALVPSSRLKSTRLSARLWYSVLRRAHPGVRRMLSYRPHEDNQGVPDFLLMKCLIFSSWLC